MTPTTTTKGRSMKRFLASAVMASLLMSGTAWAQPAPVEKKPFSRQLAGVGILTMLVGGLLMVPWPQGEDFRYYNENLCVFSSPNSFNVEKGSCEYSDPLIKAGLITVGVGAALTIVGLHKVKVSPQLGPGVVGAKVSVKW